MFNNEGGKSILNGEYKILKIQNDGQVYFSSLENYNKGIEDGVFKFFDLSGILTETKVYDNGNLLESKSNINSYGYVDYVTQIASMLKKEGQYIIYNNNEIRVCNYKNNKLEGFVYTYIHDTNKDKFLLTSVEHYSENEMLGEQIYYNAYTKPVLIENYDKGKSIATTSTWLEYFTGTDILKHIVNFKGKKRDGYSAYYYENGKLKQEMNYNHGLLEGIVTNYDENGNKFLEKYNFGSKVPLNTVDVL